MGRKPNALVSEYFTRGAKCSDTSNRYSHACKRCGENFPKGRVDSLMSHLLRRCSHTSLIERNFIYRAIQQQNPTAPVRETAKSQLPSRTGEDGETQLPTGSRAQHHSALDTLAEVSRQQLDISTQIPPSQHDDVEQSAVNVGNPTTEDHVYIQLREAVKVTPDTQVTLNVEQASERSTGLEPNSPTHATLPLIQTASAANEQLAHTFGQDNLDPALENHDASMRDELHLSSGSGNLLARQQEDRLNEAISSIPHGLPVNQTERNGSIPNTTNSLTVNNHHEPMSWVSTNGPTEVHPSSHNLRNIMETAKKPISFFPHNGSILAHSSPNNLFDVPAVISFFQLRESGDINLSLRDNTVVAFHKSSSPFQ